MQPEQENEQRVKDVISWKHSYNLFGVDTSAAINEDNGKKPLLKIILFRVTFEESKMDK